MTIGIDFDGVVHGYSRGWQRGRIYDPPVPGALRGIREVMEVEPAFIFTARDDLASVRDWLISYAIPAITQTQWEMEQEPGAKPERFWNDQSRVLVTNQKLPARKYLDDRGVTFTTEGGWERALADLEITPAEMEYLYLVTVTVIGTVGHDPKNKISGPCPVNGEPCSDRTGKHHTILVRSTDRIDVVAKKARERYGHVTRVECAPSEVAF